MYWFGLRWYAICPDFFPSVYRAAPGFICSTTHMMNIPLKTFEDCSFLVHRLLLLAFVAIFMRRDIHIAGLQRNCWMRKNIRSNGHY
jgi:hypothetical protein